MITFVDNILFIVIVFAFYFFLSHEVSFINETLILTIAKYLFILYSYLYKNVKTKKNISLIFLHSYSRGVFFAPNKRSSLHFLIAWS